MEAESGRLAGDAVEVAVRCWAPPPSPRSSPARASTRRKAPKKLVRRDPFEVLVFDTETRTSPGQPLMILVWRVYRDDPDGEPGLTCIEEGVVYPDDLPGGDPPGYDLLAAYADTAVADVAPGHAPEILLRPVSWWLEERLYRYGFEHRRRCDVAAFNALFDLGRLASRWPPARGAHRGGYSLLLWPRTSDVEKDRQYHPRLTMLALDPRRTLWQWGKLKKEDQDWAYAGEEDTPGRARTRIVDLHTLSFALTDRNHSLVTAGSAFGDEWEEAKVAYGVISTKLLDYAREDVKHTAILYQRCMQELAHHPGVELEPSKLYSPATVGVQYLRALGLAPPIEKFQTRAEVLGWAMSAFFGGRAEARIVRTPVPIVYADVNSTYPLVNTLLGTWGFLRAKAIIEEDATDTVRALVAREDLAAHCLQRATWKDKIGFTLVEIDHPEAQILPTRAKYDPASNSHGIGINPLTYQGRLWYMLPDVIASTLLTGGPPTISRAIRLTPHGVQDGLEPGQLRGGTPIHPADHDFFHLLAEERRRVEQDTTIPEAERERLALFLKITANSVGYGVLARFDRKDLAHPTTVDVHGPDDEARPEDTDAPEAPGPYCYPPAAATITAGARLLLALLEHLVTNEGGAYAFCDTDSMAIVSLPRQADVTCKTATGDTVRALSHRQVRTILKRFDDLNPFDRDLVKGVWKVEHGSLSRDPLYCYAISAKRYGLYRLDEHGAPRLVAANDGDDEPNDDTVGEEASTGAVTWSEHGLGLYLDPQDPTRPDRDQEGRRTWIRDAWHHIIRQAHNLPATDDLPAWGDRYALTRFTINRPRIEDWFTGYTNQHPDDPLRPGSFGMIADPAYGHLPPTDAEDIQPAATYEDDPTRWAAHAWYDRRSGQAIQLAPGHPEHDPAAWAAAIATNRVPTKTLRHVLAEFATRPEHKSLAPDGQPVTGATKGQLRRRPITTTPAQTRLVGKESNKLLQRLTREVTDPHDYQLDLGSREDPWYSVVLPVLQEIGAARLIADTGDPRATIYDTLGGRRPTPARRLDLLDFASGYARDLLSSWGIDIPRRSNPLDVVDRYQSERTTNPIERVCAVCGTALPLTARADARYCSPRCRKTASRRRGARRNRPGAPKLAS